MLSRSAEVVAKEVIGIGGEAIAVQANVANPEDIERLVNSTVDKFGKVDILVNNAGITRDNLIMRMSEAEWDPVLDTNLKGAFNCTKAVAKLMLRQRSGKIVNVASVMGVIGNPGQANYSASKGGIIGLTKTTAKELGSRGVNVNAVAPGFIQTVMTEEISEQAKQNIEKQIPLGAAWDTRRRSESHWFPAVGSGGLFHRTGDKHRRRNGDVRRLNNVNYV